MALSIWFCTSNTKNMLVKIVHPGGRIELHDRPILAAEIMQQNPRCCVTHPNVFREPWAILTPNEVLLLGQKYYVVPVSILKKLQKHRFRRSPSSIHRLRNSRTPPRNQLDPCKVDKAENRMDSTCLFFTNKSTPKLPNNSLKPADEERNRWSMSSSDTSRSTKEIEKEGSLTEDGCFKCLLVGSKPKGGESPTLSSMEGSSEQREVKKKRVIGNERREIKGSHKRIRKDILVSTHFDHWQPSLESISEEHPY